MYLIRMITVITVAALLFTGTSHAAIDYCDRIEDGIIPELSGPFYDQDLCPCGPCLNTTDPLKSSFIAVFRVKVENVVPCDYECTAGSYEPVYFLWHCDDTYCGGWNCKVEGNLPRIPADYCIPTWPA